MKNTSERITELENLINAARTELDGLHAQNYLQGDLGEDLLKTLPTVLRAVVKALGFIRANEWLSHHGGVNVQIPKNSTSSLGLTPNELARLNAMLDPHLDALRRVSIPKVDKLFILVRNAHIKLERQNASIPDLARRYRLSSRQILNIFREE